MYINRVTDSMAPAAARLQVVVTGLGTFTSLGNDPDTFFNNLLDGKCGIGPVTRFDQELSAVKISSEVKNFDVNEYWEPKDAKRSVLLALSGTALSSSLCTAHCCNYAASP